MWKPKISEPWWQKDKNFWEQIVRCPITKPYGKELKISLSKKVNTKSIYILFVWEMQKDFFILFILILSTIFNYLLFSPLPTIFFFIFFPVISETKNIFIPALRSASFLIFFSFFFYFYNFFTLLFLYLINNIWKIYMKIYKYTRNFYKKKIANDKWNLSGFNAIERKKTWLLRKTVIKQPVLLYFYFGCRYDGIK